MKLAKQRQQAVDRPVTINLNSLRVNGKPPYHGYTCMKQVHKDKKMFDNNPSYLGKTCKKQGREDKKMFDKLVSAIVHKTKRASD
ncbi:hypothetical protein J6590_096465 [Homalodisca vitripennis]|nr:hypothetical protein J6590_096465 [Homalodisca vitripennis]